MKKEDFKFRKFYDLLTNEYIAPDQLWRLDAYWVRTMREPQPHGNYQTMIQAVQQWIPLAEAYDYRQWVIEWRIAYHQMVAEQKERKRILSLPHNDETPCIQGAAVYAAMRLDALIWLRRKAKEMYKTLVADKAPTSTI